MNGCPGGETGVEAGEKFLRCFPGNPGQVEEAGSGRADENTGPAEHAHGIGGVKRGGNRPVYSAVSEINRLRAAQFRAGADAQSAADAVTVRIGLQPVISRPQAFGHFYHSLRVGAGSENQFHHQAAQTDDTVGIGHDFQTFLNRQCAGRGYPPSSFADNFHQAEPAGAVVG